MIKVLKITDLTKYMAKILIAIMLVIFLIQILKMDSKVMLFCIEDVLPKIKEVSSDEVDINNTKKYPFISELKIINAVVTGEAEVEEKVENVAEKLAEVEAVSEEATVTEVINSGVTPRYTNEYQGVYINNGTNYSLTVEMLTPDIEVNKSTVVIYHTHTCESYTPTEANTYVSSGNFRTIDLNYSVAKVGEELANQLISYGVTVIHDTTYHDYPSYNGSYSRSLQTALNILSTNSDADIVIDLHRDAIADETYAPKVKIGDEYVSQLMFVIGTDGANSEHTNWNDNLKFAIKVQQKANELYPGLFKPIILRNSEYNQHVASGACIIEVGATGNTLEESMAAMKYLAKILQEIE